MSVHDMLSRTVSGSAPRRALKPYEGTQTQDPLPPQHGDIRPAMPALDPDYFTNFVAQSDAAPERQRSGGNDDGYLHASSLIGMCAREQVISALHGTPTHQSVSGPVRLIWAIGRAVERHIRNSVIKARDWNGVYGMWKCRCLASSHLGEYPRHRTCPVCITELRNYFEPTLYSEAHRVIGSPDITGMVVDHWVVGEIKSMTKDQFDALTEPLADHVLQALLYRRLYRLMGFPVHDKVAIIYGRKDFKFGGPKAVYKEYHVEAADWSGQIERMMESAQSVKRHREAGTLPDRVCPNADFSRAKGCPRVGLCFQL